ncbi:MAG: PilZ domain-containing protein [Spirochaetes bacterium]|nr:PilZ domain-containing protein [Spirochaetota bacterium]
MPQGEGKREYVRVDDEFSVRLVKRDDKSMKNSLEINTSKSINISAKGILVNTDEKLDVGTVINITFIKPNSFDFFKGTGQVLRVEEESDKSYNVAINFIDLTPEDMRTLDYYIKLGQK